MEDSFWDTETSGKTSSDGGVGKTTSVMKTAATFTGAGWSTGIWNLVDNSYPTLKGPTPPNNPPTDLSLSASSVPENQAPGAFVGEFNATDANEEDVHTFALIEGNGSTHNHLFAIVDGPGSASQDMSIDFSLPHDVQGPPKQWFKDLEIGEIGGTLILDLNTGLAGDRVILKLGSATIFDTGVWKTSGNSQNGDPDRFFVHFSPGSPTTFDFVEGATNSALGATQLGQVIVNSAPLGEHTLRMIGETTLTLFSAQATFTPDVPNRLVANATLDHEANATLSIRVKATDEHNASFEKIFAITVTNLVEDHDGDGIENHLDLDDDNDGYSDAEEIAASSNPLSAFSLPPVGKVIYVDDNASGNDSGTSWPNAYVSLQSALAEANGSVRTEIWVAEGVYRPDVGPGQTFNSRASTFQLKNRVELHGGFMGNEATPEERTGENEWASVLTGDVGGQNWHDDNVYHVVTASGVDRTAVLSNFRIEHGRATGPGEWDKRGAGILADNGSPRLSFLYFYGNVSYGANSGGGGLCVYNGGSPAIFSCIFIGNYAEWGGAVKLSMGSSAALYNVLMVKNQAVKGGALVAWDSNASVIHSTIVDNNATTGGGLYMGGGAIVAMANSIIWDNNATTSQSLYKDSSSYVDFNHTMVKEVNDTASADEFFFDPERFDYRLRNGSPLINAGNPLSAGIMPMDLHGLPRNQDAAPDIGVYEGGLDVVDLGGQVTYSGIVDSGPFQVWLNDENGTRLKELEINAPGAYSFPVLSGEKYDVKAFRDANSDGWPNNGDPWAHYDDDPIEVNASRNDFNVALVDRDSDEDGFLDLHEEQAGTNPYDANSTPGLDFGLVAHWTFDETNGSVLHDASGNDVNGTLNGFPLVSNAHWQPGRIAGSLRLDGLNDHIAFPGATVLDDLNPFSFSGWIKPEAGNDGYLVAKRSELTGFWRLSTTPSALSWVRDFSGSESTGYTATTPQLVEQWRHLAFTWNGEATGEHTALYIDGVKFPNPTRTNGTGSMLSDSGNLFTIGNRPQNNTSHFKGLLDDYRIWNRSLSRAEVAELYAMAPPEPVAVTDANFDAAVNLWFSNEANATATYGHIKDWNVSGVTNMAEAFKDKASFNEDISAWEVGNVTNMASMFQNATAFNQPIGDWNVSSVTNMQATFMSASSFNQDIGNWNVSAVTNMYRIFHYASSFNQPIGDWNVSNVLSMSDAFHAATSFDQDISGWNTSAVTNMGGMFVGTASFDQDISDWNVSAVTSMYIIFYNAYALSDVNKGLIHGSFSKNANWTYDWSAFVPGPSFAVEDANFTTVENNASAIFVVTATDPDANATLVYSKSGPDAGKFDLNATSGVFRFITLPDYEANASTAGNNTFFLTIMAFSSETNATVNVIVHVTDVHENNPPAIAFPATAAVPENTTFAMDVNGTDPDGDALAYSIAYGDDHHRFDLNATSGALVFIAPPDFENPTDAGENNVYELTVQVTDGEFNATKNLAITVVDVHENDPPAIASPATAVVPENTIFAMEVNGTDPDGDFLVYSIAYGDDQNRFDLNATSGALVFIAPPDFENPTDAGANNVYELTVQVTDGEFNATKNLAITVVDIHENDPPAIASPATASVPENTILAMDLNGTDPDGDTLVYSIAYGDDKDRFQLNVVSGELVFIALPDFENPTDAGANNVYELTVQVTDGEFNATKNLAITVVDVHENDPPAIASPATAVVPENTTFAMELNGTDPDGDSLVYSIAYGDDHHRFDLNATSGELTFLAPPDFENPSDDDSNNVYELTVQVTDGEFNATKNLAITVVDVHENAAPVITSPFDVAVPENTIFAMEVNGTDPDGDALVYSIAYGDDHHRFDLNATSGALAFLVPPDFENPTDDDANNIYELTVQVTDGEFNATKNLAITVVDVHENDPPAIASPATAAVPENTTFAIELNGTDPNGDFLVYSIAYGDDQNRFDLNATSGALVFIAPPDFENPTDAGANNVYELTVQVTDGEFNATKNLTITVVDVHENDPPAIASPATAVVPENTTFAMEVNGTDPDDDFLVYSIAYGDDQNRFDLNATSGTLTFLAPPDFENPSDDDANNVYELTVQVTDGEFNATKNLAITVVDVHENDPPAIASPATAVVPENTTFAMELNGTDPDGDALVYSIVYGDDQNRFDLNATSGELTFLAPPDFENPTDDDANNVYELTVQVTDGEFNATKNLAITVVDVHENDPPAIASPATAVVPENTIFAMEVNGTDPDGDFLVYSIAYGDDQNRFDLNATSGTLIFLAPPDFENPNDDDANNVYELTVQVTDGEFNATKNLAITVVDVHENDPPAIASPATAVVPENTIFAMDVNGTDPDGDALVYSIAYGDDQNRFDLNATSGALIFLAPPDFESPSDDDANNVYELTVQVTDGEFNATKNLTITVVDVHENDPPAIASPATAVVPENTIFAMEVNGTDPDGDFLVYSIAYGDDQNRFDLNATSGTLTFLAPPDFENPTDDDANNVYELTVQVTDGEFNATKNLAITVVDVHENDPPAIASPATAVVPENTIFAMEVNGTDPDGDTLVYSIAYGDDQNRFDLNATSGALIFLAPPDFENPNDDDANNVYELTVQVTDGEFNATKNLAITVVDVHENDPPAIASPATAVVPENTIFAMDVNGTDPDGDALVYSIAYGDDQNRFDLNATSGALIFLAPPDFENPTDAGANNVYELTVQVTDGEFNATKNLAITVVDVHENDPPAIASPATAVVPENTIFAMEVNGTDPDGDFLVYSIAYGDDQNRFDLNATSGALTFLVPPDFENPTDDDANNVYELTVQVTDGEFNATKSFAVTISDVNETAGEDGNTTLPTDHNSTFADDNSTNTDTNESNLPPAPVYAPIASTLEIEMDADGRLVLKGLILTDGGTPLTQTGFILSQSLFVDLASPEAIVIEGTLTDDIFTATSEIPDFGDRLYYRAYAINSAGTNLGAAKIFAITEVIHTDPWWFNSEEAEAGWRISPWFGTFRPYENGWLYHADLGWLFAQPDGVHGLWFWSDDHGWFWTNPDSYRYLYRTSTSEWLYFLKRKDGRAYFYNYATGSVE